MGLAHKGKTGVSTSIIINTRDEKHYAIQQKKDRQKKKRAVVCLDCKENKEGFCSKHNEWCSKCNYLCAGSKNPYPYKPPPPKVMPQKKKKSKGGNGNAKVSRQRHGKVQPNQKQVGSQEVSDV